MEANSSDGSWSVNGTHSLYRDDSEDEMWGEEEKRKSDARYRQRLKEAAEQVVENKHLKEKNEELNAELTRLKEQIVLLRKQLQHQSVSLQDDKFVSMELSASHPISNGDADAAITDFLMKLEADDESKVKFSDFTGLDGERIKVGKYSVPLSLLPIVKNIIDSHGDVFATGKMNPCAAESIYIMFCASVKEMSNLRLEQVTEDLLLKWRDAIKDALRINFKVDFAMEHLKNIARAYIHLMERIKLENVALRIFNFADELSAETEEINDKPVSSGEQPIIDYESVNGGDDDFDGVCCCPSSAKKMQLSVSRHEFLETSFEVENKPEPKRKLSLALEAVLELREEKRQNEELLRVDEVAVQEKWKEIQMLNRKKLEPKRELPLALALEAVLEKIRQETTHMVECLRVVEVALQEKVKENEMLRRKKLDLLAMEANKRKLIDDFMVSIEAIEKNDMENAQNFDAKTMMGTIITMMNTGGGVVDHSGNT